MFDCNRIVNGQVIGSNVQMDIFIASVSVAAPCKKVSAPSVVLVLGEHSIGLTRATLWHQKWTELVYHLGLEIELRHIMRRSLYYYNPLSLTYAHLRLEIIF